MPHDVAPPTRVGVLHMNQLGDLIFSLPALAALRSGFPDARIISVLRHGLSPILAESQLIDDVVTHRGSRDFLATAEGLRSLRPDLTIGLSESPRSRLLGYMSGAPRRVGLDGGPLASLLTDGVEKTGLPSSDNNLRLIRRLGLPVKRESYVGLLEATSEDREAARDLLLEAGWSPDRDHLVVLAPAVSKGREHKRWPPERFAQLAAQIATEPRVCAVTVGAEAGETTAPSAVEGCLDLAGRTSLRDLTGLLSQADSFVGNDSGVLHLAACLGVPCVALFGPTDPAETGPHGDGHVVLQVLDGEMSNLPVARVVAAVESVVKGGAA